MGIQMRGIPLVNLGSALSKPLSVNPFTLPSAKLLDSTDTVNFKQVRFGNAEKMNPKGLSDEALEKLNILVTMNTQTFRDSFAAVVNDAKSYVEKALEENSGEKTAFVLDIDETLIDNTALTLMQLTSDEHPGKVYYQWHNQGEAKAIPETLEFFNWLNKKGVTVFFVSAAKEFLRDIREKNLTRIGVPPESYGSLYLLPEDWPRERSKTGFKQKSYADIEAQGYNVLGVMGDQPSDLEGAPGKGFLLPNPLYNVH